MNNKKGPPLFRMAWRNLWRNRRRTIITLVSFAFGVMLAIVFTGMGDKTYSKMIELASRLGSGHVTYQHPEYLEAPALEKRITGVSALLKRSRDDAQIVGAVERITGAAMVATAANSAGALFVAVDPAYENKSTLAVFDNVAQGEWLNDADDSGALVGSVLAESLNLSLGKKLVYTLTDPEGNIVSGLSRVKGIIQTGTESVDAGLVILGISHVRKTIGFGDDEATMVAVFAKEHRQSDELASRLRAAAPAGTVALKWSETQPDLAGFISIDRAVSVFFQIVIMLLITAGIFNSLFVSVMERQREFGIMLALGFKTRQIFALVFFESLCLALLGLVFAAALTAWPYHYLATTGIDFSGMVGDNYEVSGIGMDPIIRVGIYLPHLLMIAVSACAVTLISGIYPAWRAGRFEPVETIRLQ